MIITQYRMTLVCDTCEKRHVINTVDNPPSGTVPDDWIRTAPPGTSKDREFCSVECLSNWESPVKPWNENEDEF